MAVGSPIGPVLAGSFMVELEITLIPQLCEHMISWKRFVDDTITSIKPISIPYVINVLNSFHSNIEFTYEQEKDGQIPFLDVLLVRKNDTFKTTVYRKPTNNCIYLHWNSFVANTWKRGTLRSIITRAYDVCSNDEFLKQELSKIKADFLKINGYLKWVFDQIHQKVIEHREVSTEISKNDENNSTESTNNNTNKVHIISLPYKGDKGKNLMKSLNNTLANVLPQGHTTKIVYSGKKLGSYFNIKDQTKMQHQNDLIYYTACPENDCMENHVGDRNELISMVVKTTNHMFQNIRMSQEIKQFQ